jgi:hypothetical protein
MSHLKRAIVVAGMISVLGTAAYASDATELSLKPNQGSFVNMKGHAMIGEIKTPSAEMMAHAQEVPPGTLFFMHEGKLMMVYDRSLGAVVSQH